MWCDDVIIVEFDGCGVLDIKKHETISCVDRVRAVLLFYYFNYDFHQDCNQDADDYPR